MKMTQYLKWKADPSKGEVFTPISLVSEMLDKIPDEVWKNPNSMFLDPCMGKGTFLIEIVRRLTYIYGYTETDAKSRVYGYDIRVKYINHLLRRGFVNVRHKDFLNENILMKFDAIVGNPPFQDGSKKGGQNKIYLDFAKKSMNLLKENGHLFFITPTSILKKTKRFSLSGLQGLKFVNFDANNYFKQGIKICSWLYSKNHNGNIEVFNENKTEFFDSDDVIYNSKETDPNFFRLYHKLKENTKRPESRMFQQNPVDTKTGRKSQRDDIFQYPVHKIDKGEKIIVQYNKPRPKSHGLTKLVIPITKGFSQNSCIIDVDDYDVAHLFINVNNDVEIQNIKSFIFSEYFIHHVEKWKKLDGYGFNYALKHLPKFDITKNWTSEEVKLFLESYND